MNILLIFNNRYSMDYTLKKCVFNKLFNNYVKEIDTWGWNRLSDTNKIAAVKVKIKPFCKRKFIKSLENLNEATYFIIKE